MENEDGNSSDSSDERRRRALTPRQRRVLALVLRWIRGHGRHGCSASQNLAVGSFMMGFQTPCFALGLISGTPVCKTAEMPTGPGSQKRPAELDVSSSQKSPKKSKISGAAASATASATSGKSGPCQVHGEQAAKEPADTAERSQPSHGAECSDAAGGSSSASCKVEPPEEDEHGKTKD